MLSGLRILCALCVAATVGCSDAGRVKPGSTDPVPVHDEYRIGPGDQLSINVFGHPELSVAVPVLPDGHITTPLAYDVQAAGKTSTELAGVIEKALSEYVRSPKVSVIVAVTQGNFGDQIRVVGQAANPQSVPYRTGMTLLDVMIAVRGLGEFAAGNRAKIIRRSGDKYLEIPVRARDLVNKGDLSANLPMQPGDVLMIPETRF